MQDLLNLADERHNCLTAHLISLFILQDGTDWLLILGQHSPLVQSVMPRSRSNPKLSSPCSPKAVHKVISRFSPEKKQLVRSIGFGGLLELPLHRKIGHRFSVWLLTKVVRDAAGARASQPAAAGKVAGIPFYPHDVSKVFGVPSGGCSVPKKDQVQVLVTDEAKATVRGALGLDEGDDSRLRILHAAKHVLKKKFRRGMAEKDRAAFKIAFVVFVVENLLAPREMDSVSLDYFMALRRPDEIQTYDWSEYVIRVILDSAREVQAAFAQGRPVENLFGCILFLQVGPCNSGFCY